MEFNPANKVIQLCIQGMELEEKGKAEEASSRFLQAWTESTNDFEKFTAAHYLARHQETVRDKLKWLETSLQFALKINRLGEANTRGIAKMARKVGKRQRRNH